MARLEAGDWVVARGEAGAASPGLGKLSGGEYAEERLVRARVELASGVRWFAPRDLERVPPIGEAALVAEALRARLLPSSARASLEERLGRYRDGRLEFRRTPGLLDALWAVHRDEQPLGLAALFEVDAARLAELIRAHPGPRFVEADDLIAEAEEDAWGWFDAPEPDDEDDDHEEDLDLWGWDEDFAEEELLRVASWLARALLGGGWTRKALRYRIERAFVDAASWSEALVERLLEAYPDHPELEPDALGAQLLDDEALLDAWLVTPPERRGRRVRPAGMRSVPFLSAPVPPLEDAADVAAWLRLDPPDLDWLADPQLWLVREPAGPLQHYHHRFLRKRTGGRRLVEAPKELTKWVQRRILREVLDRAPPHDAAHGFRAGRSVVSFAAPHCGQDLVLRMDLREFFPSVGAARVAAIFGGLGYPEAVAQLLAQLTTTRTPEPVLDEAGLGAAAVDRLRRRHLPQGAPTSPALANLAAYGLDVRLAAAAEAVSATYTRYADDLAFSGGPAFRRQASRFRRLVCRIALEEGFEVRWAKNRWMRPCDQQRLTGLVVNDRPRPSRARFDRLKATLHNCVVHGPATQNRADHPDFEAHLRGRVAWFEHVDPRRGARLREAFERIDWPS